MIRDEAEIDIARGVLIETGDMLKTCPLVLHVLKALLHTQTLQLVHRYQCICQDQPLSTRHWNAPIGTPYRGSQTASIFDWTQPQYLLDTRFYGDCENVKLELHDESRYSKLRIRQIVRP